MSHACTHKVPPRLLLPATFTASATLLFRMAKEVLPTWHTSLVSCPSALCRLRVTERVARRAPHLMRGFTNGVRAIGRKKEEQDHASPRAISLSLSCNSCKKVISESALIRGIGRKSQHCLLTSHQSPTLVLFHAFLQLHISRSATGAYWLRQFDLDTQNRLSIIVREVDLIGLL
jgi:hypothetical protein